MVDTEDGREIDAERPVLTTMVDATHHASLDRLDYSAVASGSDSEDSHPQWLEDEAAHRKESWNGVADSTDSDSEDWVQLSCYQSSLSPRPDDGSLPFQPQRDYEDQIQQPDPPGSSEDQVAPAEEITIDDEKRTAILGAMKNIKLDYMPSWAVHLSQRDWDNTVAHIAIKQSKK